MPVVTQEENTATLAFDQDFVAGAIPEHKQEQRDLLLSSDLRLDLSSAKALDTAGVALLIAVRNSLAENNGALPRPIFPKARCAFSKPCALSTT